MWVTLSRIDMGSDFVPLSVLQPEVFSDGSEKSFLYKLPQNEDAPRGEDWVAEVFESVKQSSLQNTPNHKLVTLVPGVLDHIRVVCRCVWVNLEAE